MTKKGAKVEYDTSVIFEESKQIDMIILNLSKLEQFEL